VQLKQCPVFFYKSANVIKIAAFRKLKSVCEAAYEIPLKVRSVNGENYLADGM
jgi:hypothetical protein